MSAVEPITIVIGDGGSFRGVAGTDRMEIAAITFVGPSRDAALTVTTSLQQYFGQFIGWRRPVDGRGGPIALAGKLVVAALSGTGHVGDYEQRPIPPPVQGEPGAAIVAFDRDRNLRRWRVPLDASEWVVVSAIAGAPDGVIVGGSFSGSLRAADRVVSSGGKSDGFVAKLTLDGQVAWLVRIGGSGPDAVQGVAARGDQIAIAGTFAAGADFLGQALPAFDEKSPFADVFVASLAPTGARVWATTFGGKEADTVAGVTIDDAGRVVVAANARDVIHVGGADLVAQGPADGLVAWWTKDGTASHAILIGGPDFDGLQAITTVGARIVVAGFYSGAMQLGDRSLSADGGDGAFLAALDPRGVVVTSWEVSGVGREEVTALNSVPGGFIAGIAYTAAASIEGTALVPPKYQVGGAALVVRPVN